MADVQLSGVLPTSAASGLSASALTAALPVSEGGGGVSGGALNIGQGQAAGTGASQASGGNVPGQLPSDGQIKAAVADANQALAAIGTQLVFVFDDQAHHLAVKLLDVQTQKVLQQIPSKAMLDAASALSGPSSSGALVDTKA